MAERDRRKEMVVLGWYWLHLFQQSVYSSLYEIYVANVHINTAVKGCYFNLINQG